MKYRFGTLRTVRNLIANPVPLLAALILILAVALVSRWIEPWVPVLVMLTGGIFAAATLLAATRDRPRVRVRIDRAVRDRHRR
ncbi:MAG: hypothetical protein P4M00_07210 [Azospirillaceae bacterium]|nr:hypothetical protein [Azospirillaceae bacterium]